MRYGSVKYGIKTVTLICSNPRCCEHQTFWEKEGTTIKKQIKESGWKKMKFREPDVEVCPKCYDASKVIKVLIGK